MTEHHTPSPTRHLDALDQLLAGAGQSTTLSHVAVRNVEEDECWRCLNRSPLLTPTGLCPRCADQLRTGHGADDVDPIRVLATSILADPERLAAFTASMNQMADAVRAMIPRMVTGIKAELARVFGVTVEDVEQVLAAPGEPDELIGALFARGAARRRPPPHPRAVYVTEDHDPAARLTVAQLAQGLPQGRPQAVEATWRR